MARINIEDSLWKDDRFQDLMIRVANRHTAKGMLVELWSLAQEFWFPERKLIPVERIRRSGLDLMLEVGLAIEKEGGVFAVGTEKAFDWLFQKQSAGRKGGRPKKEGSPKKRTKADGKRPVSDDKRAQAAESGTNRTEPSSSFLPSPILSSASSSASDSHSNSDSESNQSDGLKIETLAFALESEAGEQAGEGESPGKASWRAYKLAYAKKYGEPPVWNSKLGGQLKQFIARVPKHEAAAIAEFYLTHPAYMNAMHPIGMLLRDAEKLRTEWATGRRMTSGAAKNEELRVSNAEFIRDRLAQAGQSTTEGAHAES